MQPQKIVCSAIITLLSTLTLTPESLSAQLTQNSHLKLQNGIILAQIPNNREAEASQLLEQGTQQLKANQVEAAIESWQQALTIYRQLKNRQGEGWAVGNLGAAYYSINNYNKAIEYYQQSLAIAQEINDPKGQLYALGNLGIAYKDLGNYEKAMEYHEQDLALARKLGDKSGEGSALNDLGNVYKALGDYVKALEAYEQSLAFAREVKDRQGEANALGSLAVVYKNFGNYTKAIENNEQTLIIMREIGNQRGEAIILSNLGDDYYALSNYPKAIEMYEQSLAIFQFIKHRLGEANALGNLGRTYKAQSNYPKAIEFYRQTLDISREIGYRSGEATTLNLLGTVYHDQGDVTQAINLYQQSLIIAREIRNPSSEGTVLGNLAIAYQELGEYAKAIEQYEQTLSIMQSLSARQEEATVLGNLGTVYFEVGDYAKAIEKYNQHLAIAKEIGDRNGQGTALGNLGIVYRKIGEYAKAIDYHEEQLAIAKEIGNRSAEGTALGQIGLVYDDQSEYAQAINYYKQHLAVAREVGNRLGEAKALGNMGLAYHFLNDYQKAIEYDRQSLEIVREIKNPISEGSILNNLGLSLFRSGNLPEAEKTLLAGIQVLESLRAGLKDNDAFKVSIFETQRNTYTTLEQVLIAQNKPEEALEMAERGRARAFVELLAGRLSPETADQIAPPNIEQIKQIAKQQNATLVEYSIINDDFNVKNKQSYQESELFIWVIKPTGEVAFRRSDLKPLWQQQNTSLSQLVTNSRESIGVRGRGLGTIARVSETEQANRLQQLHQLLISPIADLLPADPEARVTFIPQKQLFLVPFSALQDQAGKYLIEKHTIVVAPAIQVLDLTHRQRQQISGTNTLVVGNPTMPSISLKPGDRPQQLSSLPGAEREALAIAQMLNTQAITGAAATKEAITKQMPAARLIHLATHGLLDDFQGSGVPGAIALAPSKGDTGLLSAGEILQLKLNADLVVLSACDTAGGRITGDGVIGLSRALIAAGVPSTIVSLWAVPDAPTASLMTEFYRNLLQKQDKAQALRSAMLTTMQQYPNPKDWAAFTLIGEAL
ncbi:CHAT domain-containing protein [Microcoleus sp. FACHB-672]|uniref:CHAT domain-containing protein n=1 Tax=Microcoleus sp. FACHB-672 TaxID=2692825 RepID=UPI0016835B17|nr:CHAT domain-containing protein [Microcoleus sp. FACHB-672]MBD2042995.1 tetratricopeptide repeat protein [Microcoleus sp. FACHB-672]